MTRKHLELAAKLWALALVAHTDCDDPDEVKGKIRHLASFRAKTKLKNLGVSASELLDEDDAVAVARRLVALKELRLGNAGRQALKKLVRKFTPEVKNDPSPCRSIVSKIGPAAFNAAGVAEQDRVLFVMNHYKP